MAKISDDAHGTVGTRVRDRRMIAGIKQSDLASRAGISPSYLNLIEHNRRRIGGKLLKTFADVLKVEPQLLSHGAEAGLIEGLHDASVGKTASDMPDGEAGHAAEFAERFPGWARLVATQKRRISQLEAIIDGLNDRLTHDPVLSETMHDVLSTASAIRSTASILVATPDIDAEWRQRFHANIDTESRRLAETSAAMAEHFEHLTEASAAYVTPLEATQALFDAHGHHFEAIEAVGRVAIDDILAPRSYSGETMRTARQSLESYADRAAVFPIDVLTAHVAAHGFSQLPQLAAAHSVGLDVVLRRLAELPHMPELPDMGCIQCDGAGALITRNQVAGFATPRFGAACNLWPLFAAMAAPNQPVKQVIKTSEGVAFTTYSVANLVKPPSFDEPSFYRSTMLIVSDAPSGPSLDIGPACRVCPHASCIARREPSILDSFTAAADTKAFDTMA